MKRLVGIFVLGIAFCIESQFTLPSNTVLNPYTGTLYSTVVSANDIRTSQVNYTDGSIQTSAFSGSVPAANLSSSTDITLQANSLADDAKYSVLFKNGANEILEAYGDRVAVYTPMIATAISANTLQARTSSGLSIKNNNNDSVVTLGAGGSQSAIFANGATFTGVINVNGASHGDAAIEVQASAARKILDGYDVSSNEVFSVGKDGSLLVSKNVTANAFYGNGVGVIGVVTANVALTALTSNTAVLATTATNQTGGTVSANGVTSSVMFVGIVNSSNLRVESDGTLILTGNATSWDDLRVAPNARTSGQNAPTFTQFFTNGAGSRGTYLYAFDDASITQEKEVFFTMQMPHTWKVGSPIYMHAHWIPQNGSTAGQRVVWGLEYNLATTGGTFGNTTIVVTNDMSVGNITVANSHSITAFPAIDMTGMGISTILTCRIYRNSSAVADTYTGTAGLLFVDAHYEVDSFGSRTEYTK